VDLKTNISARTDYNKKPYTHTDYSDHKRSSNEPPRDRTNDYRDKPRNKEEDTWDYRSTHDRSKSNHDRDYHSSTSRGGYTYRK
jgi:hypothetical protein